MISTKRAAIFIVAVALLISGWPGLWKTQIPKAHATAAIPTFVACGAYNSPTTNAAISPALPAGIATNDILVMFLETANQAITIPTPNGGTWTETADSPEGTGTAAGTSATRLTVFWSRYNGTQGNPTTSSSGDHQDGIICAWRGVANTGSPWDVTSGGVEATSDTSWSITGDTTTVANTLVVVAGARMDDNATARFSAETNANLASIAERADGGATGGNGGGLFVAEGQKAAAGTYAATTVTNSTTTVKGFITIALKPPQLPTATTQAASSITETTAVANGNITDTGGATPDKRGFVYDTSSHGLPGDVAPGSSGYASFAEDTGSFSAGAYTKSLTGLSSGSTYFARAYTHNSTGYSYGGEVSFTTAIISIVISSDGTVTYGTMPVNTNKDTTSGSLNDTQVATNNGNVAEDFNIKGQNSAGWTLSGSAGSEQYVHSFCTAGSGSPDPCDASPTWTALTTSYQSLVSNLAVSGTKRFDLKLSTPTTTATASQQSVDITVQAVIH